MVCYTNVRWRDGEGLLPYINEDGVSCPLATSCLVNEMAEAQQTRYNFFAVSSSKFSRKLVLKNWRSLPPQEWDEVHRAEYVPW